MAKKIELFLHVVSLLLLTAVTVFMVMDGRWSNAGCAAFLAALNVIALRILVKKLRK